MELKDKWVFGAVLFQLCMSLCIVAAPACGSSSPYWSTSRVPSGSADANTPRIMCNDMVLSTCAPQNVSASCCAGQGGISRDALGSPMMQESSGL